MTKVVEVKLNKVAVGMIVVGFAMQLAVLGWLVYPRKVE